MSGNDDQLINDYLNRLASAAAALPADRRDELIEEITAHISEARAKRAGATDQEPSSIASVLDRLGSPEDIVRAAAEQLGTGYSEPRGFSGAVRTAPGSGWTGAAPPWPWRPMTAGPGVGALEICAVILLLVGGFLAGIGWIVGAILLWISPRWRVSDKLLGTLIWPGGLAVVVVLLGHATAFSGGSAAACSGGGPGPQGAEQCTTSPSALPGWLGVTLVMVTLLVAVGGPIAVAARLVRRARRWPGRRAADPTFIHPV